MYRIYFFIICIAMLVSLSTSAVGQPFPVLLVHKDYVSEEKNVDFPGNDYKRIVLDSSDVDICKERCGADSKCTAYTYVKPGIQESKAVCYLKNRISVAKKNDCCTSGVKRSGAKDIGEVTVEPHTDRYGLDYTNFELNQQNPLLCAEKCKNDSKCAAYTYVKSDGHGSKPRCFLKNGIPQETGKSCCISGMKVPSSGKGTSLVKGKVVGSKKSCQQSLITDIFNTICKVIPNTECEISTENCYDYTRQLYIGSTFKSSNQSEIRNWDYIGGRGRVLSDAVMCSFRELSPEAIIAGPSRQTKGGPIETKKTVSIGIGDLSYKQRIGFIDFDQSKKIFKGYRSLSFCAPILGCYDAVAQDIKVEPVQYTVSPQLRAGAAGPKLNKFYALNVTTETSEKSLYLKPPSFKIATPIGPVSVQPRFDYASRESVIASPFKNGNDRTLREEWGRRSFHKDIYGVDYGIAFPMLYAIDPGGWNSPIAFGNRDPSSTTKAWSPTSARDNRPDSNLRTARSDVEKKPSVEMTAKARATYPDAGSSGINLPGWLSGLGGKVELSIFVEPQARAAFSSELSMIAAEAAIPAPDIGAGGTLTKSDLSIRTATAGTFELKIQTGLDLTVTLPLIGKVVDTHPRWPVNLLSKPTYINGEQAYFASSDGPWTLRVPREYNAFKTFKTDLNGLEAKNAYKYVEKCLAPDKQLKQQPPPPPPKATAGDPKELFEKAEWPCNICVFVDYQKSGLLFEADRPSSAYWPCDSKIKNGCYDICSLNPSTGKMTFKRSPDSSLKFKDGSTGDKCYLDMRPPR